jgi:hypothetical protein
LAWNLIPEGNPTFGKVRVQTKRADNSNKGDFALSHPKSEKVTATDG